MFKNDNFIKALYRQPVDRTPVWVMRQAGRYLPEYRKVRAEVGSFMELCRNPELAAEVTLQPLARFDLDAAIIFSDILVIPDAMGMGLYFDDGPKFDNRIASEADIDALADFDPNVELKYVMDAVATTSKALDKRVPLIGFCGSPWTLATYMVEGQSSRNYHLIKKLMYQQPAVLHRLLDKVSQSLIHYLKAKVEAGANALMIFDSWGGILSPATYHEFSLRWINKIVSELKPYLQERHVPLIVFSKGCAQHCEAIAATGCDAIGIDWTASLGDVRRQVGDKVALQGNLDPAVLLAEPDVIRRHVKACLEDFGEGPGHVFNLGHGITPDVPPEHVAVLVDAVHSRG
jgi:uroporphyrinogen decarboxylase